MPAFDDDEIKVGAQPFLNEEALRKAANCRTTAPIVSGKDRSASKNRNYQIVDVDIAARKCLAAPVVTAKKPGKKHIRLKNNLKTNFPTRAKWGGHYLHEEQMLEIPFDTLKEASAGDISGKGKRRAYAPDDPIETEKVRDRFLSDGQPIRAFRDLGTSKNSN